MGGAVAAEMEEEGNEGGSGGLAGEASGGEHAAGAAGAVVGGGGQEHVVVWRLEEAEAGTAEGQPPAEVYGSGISGNVREKKAAGAHHQQAEAAEDAGMDAAGERAGQRGDEHHHEGPGGHHRSGMDGIHPEIMQQHERHADQDHHLGGVGDNTGNHRHGEHRTAQQVEGQHRVPAVELGADVDSTEDSQQDDGTDDH